jgi:hypothetical protein
MKQPDLQMLAQWLDPALIAALENRRRLNNECKRRRKLQTLPILNSIGTDQAGCLIGAGK